MPGLRRPSLRSRQAPGRLPALRRRGRSRAGEARAGALDEGRAGGGGSSSGARRSAPAAPRAGTPAPQAGPPPQWSPEQAAALDKVGRWLAAGEPQVFRLFGYAGVGKTTLAKRLAEFGHGRDRLRRLHRQGGAGDAIEGLRRRVDDSRADLPRQRGRRRRADLHPQPRWARLARRADRHRRMLDGRRRARPRPAVVRQADPGAWRPGAIAAGQGRRLLHRGRARCDADDDPSPGARTIRSSACREIVRSGGEIAYGQYGESRVIRRDEIDAADVLAADQVLLGVNRTRRLYNQRIRQLQGTAEPLPVAGDKLVCLRNDRVKGLINGGLWRVETFAGLRKDFVRMTVKSEDDPGRAAVKVAVLRQFFEGVEADLPYRDATRIRRVRLRLRPHRPQGARVAVGLGRAVRREPRVSRASRPLALHRAHARGAPLDAGALTISRRRNSRRGSPGRPPPARR